MIFVCLLFLLYWLSYPGKYVVHKLWPRQGTVKTTQYFNVSGSTRRDRDAKYAEASKKFIY